MYYEMMKNDAEVQALLKKGDENLGVLGFTKHDMEHCTLVAEKAGYILDKLGFSEHEQELVKVAGIMHDIGNAVNRTHHAELGALLANDILRKTDMCLEDRIQIISAIGNHDGSTGGAKDIVSSALIIADKSDVRTSRVREKDKINFDIHDQVNYSVVGSHLRVDPEERIISLNLQINEKVCSMYEYFDIFLNRMTMCRKAAEILNARFRLLVNGIKIL